MVSSHLRYSSMSLKVKLNEWWCDFGEFQALGLFCSHVIDVCFYCHLNLLMFVDQVYNLHNVYKIYEVSFHLMQNEKY